MMTNSTTVGRWIQICDRLWLSALEQYPHHITTDRISDITQYRRVFLCISYLTVSLPLLSSPGNVFQTHGQDNSSTVLYKILSHISHPDYINVSDGEKGLHVDWKMWLQWKELSTCKMFWIVTDASLGLWVYVVWTTSLGLWWLGNIPYALICKWCECSCRMMQVLIWLKQMCNNTVIIHWLCNNHTLIWLSLLSFLCFQFLSKQMLLIFYYNKLF